MGGALGEPASPGITAPCGDRDDPHPCAARDGHADGFRRSRLERIVGDEHASTVVVAVESAYPIDTIQTDEVAQTLLT